MGAQSGEGRDEVAGRDLRPAERGDAQHLVQPGCGRAHIVLVFDIFRGRAQYDGVLDGRGDQDAFAHRGRHLEDGRLERRSKALVEHDVLAAPRRDREGVFAELVVDRIRVDAGGVDQRAADDRPVGRLADKGPVFARYAGHQCVQADLDAV